MCGHVILSQCFLVAISVGGPTVNRAIMNALMGDVGLIWALMTRLGQWVSRIQTGQEPSSNPLYCLEHSLRGVTHLLIPSLHHSTLLFSSSPASTVLYLITSNSTPMPPKTACVISWPESLPECLCLVMCHRAQTFVPGLDDKGPLHGCFCSDRLLGTKCGVGWTQEGSINDETMSVLPHTVPPWTPWATDWQTDWVFFSPFLSHRNCLWS